MCDQVDYGRRWASARMAETRRSAAPERRGTPASASVERRVADALALLRGNRMRLTLVCHDAAGLRLAQTLIARSDAPEARRLSARFEPWGAGE